jgi:sulfur carrier protein
MKIEVNGEPRDVKAATVAGLIEELGYKDMICAVARNGGFVPKTAHDEVALAENDAIEIVAPMKGG